ncbi:lycopene cyclase family protein [Corynebacterium sp. H113]|uniref:lycopene cyclase family protein n=1 Tax=Corynebacterium sp. H113 TaxID=3133419 RepID=UPI0030B67AE3
MSPMLHVAGLGPAGRILAHRAAAHGWSVTAFDPTGGSLPSTIGVWADQMPDWAPANFLASRFAPRIVLYDGTERALSHLYGIVDPQVFGSLSGFAVEESQYPSSHRDEATTDLVVVNATNSGPHLPIRQIAYGQVFPASAIPLEHRVPVLMDFRSVGEAEADDTSVATFSYRLPLGDGTWLIEETILAVQITDSVTGTACEGLVRSNQKHRLARLGIDATMAVDEEYVNFPLGPARIPMHLSVLHTVATRLPSWAKPRTQREPAQRFGSGGGWMHPATGYSVGQVLSDADAALALLRAGKHLTPPGGWLLAHIRRRGLAALLSFSPEQLRYFFTAFFSLPEEDIYTYLAGGRERFVVMRTLEVMAKIAVPLGKKSPSTLWRLIVSFLWGL